MGERVTKAELYYVDDCPSYKQALENVRRALQLEQFPDEVELIPVADAADAQAKRFIGSPTIRIDGVDIERPIAETRGYAYGCRIYTDGGHTAGWPSVDQIRQALQRISAREVRNGFLRAAAGRIQ